MLRVNLKHNIKEDEIYVVDYGNETVNKEHYYMVRSVKQPVTMVPYPVKICFTSDEAIDCANKSGKKVVFLKERVIFDPDGFSKRVITEVQSLN